jgi:UDP-GlcNAc:undecaprenyl-phosphate GlcNAc-1-phosphate transferase
MAAVAIAMRYVPYSDDHGNFHAGWTALMAGFLLLGLAFSVYVVYTLEILKFKRFRMRAAPGASEFDIEQGIERDLETGEWDAGEA